MYKPLHLLLYQNNIIKFNYLCILEVMPPQWSDFVLTTDIPYGETDVFVLYSFNIKP